MNKLKWKDDFNWKMFWALEYAVFFGVLIILLIGIPFYDKFDLTPFILAPLGSAILFSPVGLVFSNKGIIKLLGAKK